MNSAWCKNKNACLYGVLDRNPAEPIRSMHINAQIGAKEKQTVELKKTRYNFEPTFKLSTVDPRGGYQSFPVRISVHLAKWCLIFLLCCAAYLMSGRGGGGKGKASGESGKGKGREKLATHAARLLHAGAPSATRSTYRHPSTCSQISAMMAPSKPLRVWEAPDGELEQFVMDPTNQFVRSGKSIK